MAAASYKNRIVVFGGPSYWQNKIYLVGEEGQIEEHRYAGTYEPGRSGMDTAGLTTVEILIEIIP